MMGGRIWVESKEGEGSTFHFTVSLSEANEGVAPAPHQSSVLAGTRVLVVNDNETNRRVLQGYLAREEIRPDCVGSAAEALDAIGDSIRNDRSYELVVLDAQMPELSGLDMVRRMRLDAAMQDIRLMMLTSAGEQGEVEEYGKLGIDTYLVKPVLTHNFLDAVRVTLGDRESHGTVITHHTVKAQSSRKNLGLAVLLADDSPVSQRVGEAILERFGCRVKVASNGRQALEMWEQEAFDLILMDIQMPELDGLEAIAEIRRREVSSDGLRLPS